VIGPLYLTQLLVPKMAEQGGGIVVNVSSLAGLQESAAPVGNGGWGLGYSISKAGIHRAAPGLAKELRELNIAVINVEPGLVQTERVTHDQANLDATAERMEGRLGNQVNAQESNVPGICIAHIATHKYPMVFSGRLIESFTYVVEHELVDAEALPPLYGPPNWGVPMPYRLMPERVNRWFGQGGAD
jgi:short-subunit dehydrogenase